MGLAGELAPRFYRAGQKNAQKLAASGLRSKAEELLDILRQNPYQIPPKYEKLIGDLAGAYSRRINIQHRLVQEFCKNAGSLWANCRDLPRRFSNLMY